VRLGPDQSHTIQPVTVHELSRLDARRIAVRAQLLDSRRPTGLLGVVRHLTLLQIDPTAAVAPSADLVAWSRLGWSYAPAELDTALADRTLPELRAMIRPSEDLALYRADMARWERAERGELPGWRASDRDWVRANDACRLDILDRLGSSGPLPSRDLADTCKVPWRSSGWTNNRDVTQLLELMVPRGEVAIAGRTGGDRLWDLATRVYPDDPVVPRTRRVASATSGGCVRSVSPAPGDRNVPSSRWTWAGPASRPLSRASTARGESILPCWANRSQGVRRCCRPSTG
jgi:uncharacterized protein